MEVGGNSGLGDNLEQLQLPSTSIPADIEKTFYELDKKLWQSEKLEVLFHLFFELMNNLLNVNDE